MAKKALCLIFAFLLSINSFAAIVSDNDGSAFVTKSEFEVLKNDFALQIKNYEDSIDGKIDGAIAAYLAGLQLANKKDLQIEALNMYNFPLAIGQPDAQWDPSNRHSFQLVNFYAMRVYSNTSGDTIDSTDSGLASWKVVKEENNRIPIYFVNSTNIDTPHIIGIYNQKVELESLVANGSWGRGSDHGVTMQTTCSVDAARSMVENSCYEETNLSGSYWRSWNTTKYPNQYVYFDGTSFCIDMVMAGRHAYSLVTEDVGHTGSAKSAKLTRTFSWQGKSTASNKLNADEYMDKKFDYVGDKFDRLVFCLDKENPRCRVGWYCEGTTETTNTKEYETDLSSVNYTGRVQAIINNPSIPDIWPMCKNNYENYADFKNDVESAFVRPELLYYEVYTDKPELKKYVQLTSGLPLGFSSNDGTISVDLEIDMKGPYNKSTGKYEKTQGIEVQFSKKPFKDYNPDEKDLLKSKYKGKEAKVHTIVPESNVKGSYYFTIEDINKKDEIWLLINRKAAIDSITIDNINSFAVTTTD